MNLYEKIAIAAQKLADAQNQKMSANPRIHGPRRGWWMPVRMCESASCLSAMLLVGSGVWAAPAPAPMRPPAVPLAVRSPYLSVWSPGDKLTDSWPAFWTGSVKAIMGLARIDGKAYRFCGPSATIPAMEQTSLRITPTQSIYTFGADGVEITADFLSPVEARDLRMLSMPYSYLYLSARSQDRKRHKVQIYVDITGEWAAPDKADEIVWREQLVPYEGRRSARTFTFSLAHPNLLGERNDYPTWGHAVLAGLTGPPRSDQAGFADDLRTHFVQSGRLDNSFDTNQPRQVQDHWPAAAISYDLGSVSGGRTDPVTFIFGEVRDPAVSFLDKPVAPLWKSYWPDEDSMLAFAATDSDTVVTRANDIDRQITKDALKAGGPDYASLVALSVRQAFGGVELVGTREQPYQFMKEISSDGNVSTVDAIYPAFPIFLYLNPQLIKLQIDPILYYSEQGGWPKKFAPHDLGSSYPRATGHNNGQEEDMPVEESANMLILAAAYVNSTHDAGFARTHYAILKQWADYLASNALDPVLQNQTDDFTGFIKESVNLAAKGIIGIGAFGQIAAAAGNGIDAAHYSEVAQTQIQQWQKKANAGDHLSLVYGDAASWSLKYNFFPDKVLRTNLITPALRAEETAFYRKHENMFGFPLDPRHTYTKTDWELWTAAASDDSVFRSHVIEDIYHFVNTSNFRGAFTDWYDTVSGQQVGFVARPVIGGVCSLLLVK